MHRFFFPLTKWELKICIVLKTSLGVTSLSRVIILKPSFLSSPWISFYSIANSLTSAYLFCSKCILGCPETCSAGGDGAKGTDRDIYIVPAGIESTCTRDICISSTYTVGTWIRFADVGGAYNKGICAKNAFVEGIEPEALVESEVTLVGRKVNNCCLWLWMR